MEKEEKKMVTLRLLWGDEDKKEYDDIEIYAKDFEVTMALALKEEKSIEDKFLEIFQSAIEHEEMKKKVK